MLRRKLPPGSWCVALGTIMAVVSIFDGVWGLTTAAVGVELQAIAAEVESNRLGITIGSIVRGVTFGVFSLRGVETAQHAGELLAMLPRPDYLVEVGWIRFGFSIVAFVSGVLLTWRLRFAVWTSLVWAIASVCWTTWATIRTWSVMTDGV
ncbi:MAG TPA: hypothetical protein QF800_02950, partial [Phycisphaerales bacterium]|nr:hypothetical protein [Phycisphaerales bacterium]